MSGDDLELPYEDLWYIKLSERNSKFPLEKWGGYNQDFSATDTVYSHAEVLESDWQWWGIVGIKDKPHMPRCFLAFDFDVHKASDNFNPDDVTVPKSWPLVRSQSGGLHGYTILQGQRGTAKESEFRMTADLEWDIDIRGSAVKHHVVAPADIPGVGGSYELVRDNWIPGVTDPGEAASGILYQDEPLLEYERDGGLGFKTTDVEIDPDREPPADMPDCYAAALSLRGSPSIDEHPNGHKVNVLAALCGLHAGYPIEEMVEHLTEDFPPGGRPALADPEETAYQLQHIRDGGYSPPSLETLRDYGILADDADCGCEIHQTGPSDHGSAQRHAVAPVAFERLDALAAPERKRYARKRGLDIPSTDDARDRLRDAIFREFRSENRSVLDAPTALGKSHTVATTPWLSHPDVTGDAPVVHLHATREARDDAARKTDAASRATGRVLKGRTECCPVAAGDHDPDPDAPPDEQPDPVVTIDGTAAKAWFDHLCDEKGLPFSTAHAIARERNDQGLEALPCCEEGDCRAITQWDGIPRDDNGEPAVDVVHATHQFAYVPSLRSHTNVVLDERPDYTDTFTDAGTPETETGRVREMVTAYLREIGAPVATWEAFISLSRLEFDGHTSDAIQERDALEDAIGTTPDQEWYVSDPAAHALAPDLTKAIWQALRWEDPDENNRRSTKVFHEPPRLDTSDGDSYGGTWLAVVIDEENTIQTVRTTPDFSQARSVIGLDAHPSMPMWQLNTGPEMDGSARDAVLDPHERRLWRRYERGLTVAQIGDATRPRSGGKAREWMNDDRVRAIIEQLREHYDDDFGTAITTQQVEDAVAAILDDAGIDDPETMHYGEEKSRNDFANESAGYVYGCMDAGDDMILNALAELGLDAQASRVNPDDVDAPENAACGTCSGDGCHDCNDTGLKREKGRTFDGPDADTAHAVLESVRESHVAQAAGRYARNPDDPESSAVVYVHTDAAPAGFIDLQVPGVEWLATPLQREIVNALTQRPSATTRELADDVDCSKEHVRETLSRLETHELVERHSGAGDHGADVYHDTDAPDALVDLGETTNEPLQDYSRWSLAIHDRHASSSGDSRDGGDVEGVATDGGVSIEGDPPPR